MSFTQDELQAFNAILEQRLAAHRRNLERTLDSRINVLRRELEQRLTTMQQELLRSLPERLFELQKRTSNASDQKQLDKQVEQLARTVNQELGRVQEDQQQRFEDAMGRTLAAQLLAIEQLIHQRMSFPTVDFSSSYTTENPPDFEAIEVQTEISWEDLADVVDKAMDQRLATLHASLQSMVRHLELSLINQFQAMQEVVYQVLAQPTNVNTAHIQSIFTGIEQLERVIEAMQVAMNANHALISNRLYHHQHLPPDRAHPNTPLADTQKPQANGTKPPLQSLLEQIETEQHQD